MKWLNNQSIIGYKNRRLKLILIFAICLMMGACIKHGSRVQEECSDSLSCTGKMSKFDSLACKEVPVQERINLAESMLYDEINAIEPIASQLLTPDLLDEELKNTDNIIFVKAGDKRALLATFKGDSTMITGESYLLYLRKDGVGLVLPISILWPDPKKSNVYYSSLFNKIKLDGDGYVISGDFAYSLNSKVYHDTIVCKKSDLEWTDKSTKKNRCK